MTALYHSQKVVLPVSFQIVAETEYYTEVKSGEEKRRCPVPKNQYAREMPGQAVNNQTAFRKDEFLRNYVLTDIRFASAGNMMFIRHDMKKSSVMPVKANRNIALKKMNFCEIMLTGAGADM